MLLVWTVHRLSPRTLISFHGMLHAGILEVLLRPDGMTLPPENPFYAGEPLPYYWFYHVLAAGLVRLLRMNTFHALEFLAIMAAGGLVVVAAVLGRQLYRSTLAGLLMAYLVIAGTNPLGVLYAAARVVRNGPGVLQDNPHHLWGVVHPLYSLIRYGDVGGLYGPLLNFYLNITSRPAALTALLLAALCLYRGIRDRRAWSWLWFGLAIALTTLFSPIIGITAGAAIGAGFLAVWLRSRPWSGGEAPGGTTIGVLFAAGLAMAGGVLLAAPTYYHLLTGPSASSPSFLLLTAAGLKQLVAVSMSVLPLLLMGFYGARRAPDEARQYLQVLLVAGAVLLALTVGITLPDGNSSNMFHAAVVLLAVPAAAVVLCPRPAAGSTRCSARRAVLIVAVFLPTTLALLTSYLSRPPIAASFDRVHLERTPANSERARLYRWARAETDPNAVFVIDPRNSVTLGGNIGEVPAMTGRSVFTEELDHYMAAPYPDASRRVALAVKLVSGLPPDRMDLDYLARLRRPSYLLSDSPARSALASQLRALYGQPAFQQPGLAAYRLPVTAEPPTN